MRTALVSVLLLATACAAEQQEASVLLPKEAEPADAPAPTPDRRTLVPHASWTCGLPAGIPAPRDGKPAFTAELEVLETHDVGETQYGKRTLRRFGAGTFGGAALTATLTAGGFEQDLTLENGAVELEDVLVLRGPSGAYVYLRACGLAPTASEPVRVVLDFEAANDGPHAALNGAKLVGEQRLSADGKKVLLEVFDVASVALGDARVVIENPEGVRHQSWDCAQHTSPQGAELFREVVGIGASQPVGVGKRGNRNIIPITGGTTNAPIPGKILPYGADYQILSNGYYLDARYAAQPDDGGIILIRNCGDVRALVPVFETRKDSKYAYLNDGNYRSAIPVPGPGVVNISIFATK